MRAFVRVEFSGPFKVVHAVFDDGHRIGRDPGDDISDLPQEAQDAIAAVWTPEIISAYQAATAQPPPTVEQQVETARFASFKADTGRTDLVTRLRNATPAQIDTWIDTNVTTIASARAVLKALVKVLAIHIRE